MKLLYVTCKDTKEANKISKLILKNKLAACINIISSKSVYYWKNELLKTNEKILIIKTFEIKIKEIEKIIKENHSYKIPCIINFSANENKEFLKWAKEQIK